MIDILASPILFPSDVNSSKLTADPNFKLPEPMNWTDHDYCNTMMDKSVASLTDLIKFEPVKENNIHVYSPFIGAVISPKIASVLDQKAPTGIPDDDYTQRLTLLSLAQSMIHAYTLPLTPPTGIYYQGNNNMDENDDEGQNFLWTNLPGALDVVEKDLKRNGQDSLYSSSEQQHYQGNIANDWSCPEDYMDVPDLVHSICSSPSLHFLVDDHPPPTTPVLLESNFSSHLDDGFPRQQLDATITNTVSSSPLPKSIPQQAHGKKKNKIFKNWMAKKKQDCVKSLSNASRNFRRWIKN